MLPKIGVGYCRSRGNNREHQKSFKVEQHGVQARR